MQHVCPTTETEPTGPSALTPAATELMYPTQRLCRQCGAEVPRSAKRCTHCGQPLSHSRSH